MGALSEQKIAALKEQLLIKRRELDGRSKAIRRDIGSGLNADSKEQAVELENSVVLNELDREADEQVTSINEALARIEDGIYGLCSECNEAIPEPRLNVYPMATLCIDCAELAG